MKLPLASSPLWLCRLSRALAFALCGIGLLVRPLPAAGLSDAEMTSIYNRAAQSDISFGSAAEKQAALQQLDQQIAWAMDASRIAPSESRQTLAILRDARRRAANAPIRPGGGSGKGATGAAGGAAGSPAQQMFVNQMLATYEQLRAEMARMDGIVREQALKDRAYYSQKEAEGVSRINRAAGQALSDLDALEAQEKGSSSSAGSAEAARQRQQRVLQYLEHRNALIKEIQAGGMSAELAEVRANSIVYDMLRSEGLDWSMAVIQDPQTFQPGSAFGSYPGLPPADAMAGTGAVTSAPNAPGGIIWQDGDDLRNAYTRDYFANIQPRDSSYIPSTPWRAPQILPERQPERSSSYYDKLTGWMSRQYESNIVAPLRNKWNSYLRDDSPIRWQSSPPPKSFNTAQSDGMDTFWSTGKNINEGLRHANAVLVTSPQGQAAIERMIKTNGAIIDNRGDIIGTGADVTFGLAKDYTNIKGVPKELKNMGFETVKQNYKNPGTPAHNLVPAAESTAKSIHYDILKELFRARGNP